MRFSRVAAVWPDKQTSHTVATPMPLRQLQVTRGGGACQPGIEPRNSSYAAASAP